MATSSFFYGGSSAPDQNTVDELIDTLNGKVAAADQDRVAAELAAQQAAASASNAALSETNVSGLATQAQTTLTAAEAAVASANAAVAGTAANAATATTKASEATASASAAAASQAASASSASDSASSAAASVASAATATSQATAAGTSASNAASSASAAAGSASTATTQASASSASASASASSAVDSAASASLANEWATKTSGPVAGGEYSSKYNAQQSASSASASASSASAAASSASAAASSASAASGSASTASTAATAAQAAQAAAEAVYDNFDDRYLGAKASAPSTDNDGNALVTGALYFNSTLGQMAAWNGSSWGAIGSNPDSVLGPASSTDNAIARFDGTTGKLVQNSLVTVSDAGDIAVGGTGVGYVHTYDAGINYLLIKAAGSSTVAFNGSASNGPGLNIGRDLAYSWSSTTSGNLLNSADLSLWRDAANTLAQRNSTNPQAFRVYNTYTDASNYERGFVRWNTNVLQIGTEAAGTGTARTTRLGISGTTGAVSVNTTGIALTQPDATSEIYYRNDGFWPATNLSLGLSTARWGTVFSTGADVAGNINFTGNLTKNGSPFSAGAKGGGTDAVFYENDQAVTTNYTISSGKNAGTFGPITINSGVSVTVPSGSVWTVI